LHVASPPRVDAARDIHDVLALVTLQGQRDRRLVIGLDEGRVIRVVEMPADLGHRARAQIAFHEAKRAWHTIRAEELYVLDVQAVEKQPDAPGADDPLFLYGVLRGPYPEGLTSGVAGVEGQLAVTRGELLDGFALGIDRGFVYEQGKCGMSCTHAALPIDISGHPPAAVLAFPLVPMGDDGSNELVAAEMICDVLGAMRTDLGDDLSADPVPVPNRAQYEHDLAAGGWTIKGDTAVHSGGKSRFASLFSPGKKQKLPKQAALADYIPLIAQHLARLPGWPEPARSTLHSRLGVRPVRVRPPTAPGAGAPPPGPATLRSPAAGLAPATAPCPFCGAAVATNKAACGTCGRNLPATRARPSTAPGAGAAPAPRRASSQPPCSYCGASVELNAAACGTCGRPQPRVRPPSEPPPIPPGARRREPTPAGGAPAPSAFVPRNRPPTPPPPPRRKTGPRTVMPGLTAPTPKEWIRQLIDDHSPPDRPKPRVVTPGRSTGSSIPDWMFDMIETEFPDDDK
jgi:hypothetical protein